MAKKTTPARAKQTSKAQPPKPTPADLLGEVLGCIAMTDAELDEFNTGRGDLIARDGGLEIHVTGFGVGAALGDKLEQVGAWVRHTVYEKGATVWVCLFVKLDSLPSRQS